TQENDQVCSWQYGTYVVNGDRVEWTFVDGGEIPAGNGSNKPGEFFVYGWSLYRGELTLTAVPGKISPINFSLKPWHRLDAGPSLAALSQRCPPPAQALWPADMPASDPPTT